MISACPTNKSFCVLKGNSYFIHQLSPWNEAKYINAFCCFLFLFFFLLQAVQSMKIAKLLRVPVVLCCMKAGSYNFGIKIRVCFFYQPNHQGSQYLVRFYSIFQKILSYIHFVMVELKDSPQIRRGIKDYVATKDDGAIRRLKDVRLLGQNERQFKQKFKSPDLIKASFVQVGLEVHVFKM